MTSFMQTMFVPNSPPQPYSPPLKPLPALQCNVLAESETCLCLSHSHEKTNNNNKNKNNDNPSWHPSSPQSVYQSPLQRHIKDVFDSNSSTNSHLPPRSHIPVPVRQEERQHAAHRIGFGDILKRADLLTRTPVAGGYSNARNRNQQSSFQPQKRAKGTSSWQLKQFAEATLGNGSLRKVVQLPEGEDRDEWLAVNGRMCRDKGTMEGGVC